MAVYEGDMNDENLSAIFGDSADFIRRELWCSGQCLYAYAIDGLIAAGAASDYVVKPIAEQLRGNSVRELYQLALRGAVYNVVADSCEDLQAAAMKLVNGFCVVLFPGEGAIAFEVKTPDKRGPTAPDVETTVKGAKDAFVETVRSNTSYVRRHLRSPDLRIYETQIGKRSLTNVSLVWLEGVTNFELVSRMKRRLSQIDIDGMITPSSVEEYITGSRKTAFPLLQYTERPDRFCSGILKGRVGLLVDGLPVGYLAPVDIGYLMNSPEDMSRDYISASWVRILRYAALLIALLLPAVYVAMTVYHSALIPPVLLNIIEESRDGLPYSSAWEVLGLLIAFELLQETGIHLPHNIAQSVSIIGGIVLGTTAVEAGLISPMALIVVSLVGICGFVIPNRDLAAAVRLSRFLLALAGAVFGITGVAIGGAILVLHLSLLRSLGVPYLVFAEPKIIRQRLVKDKRRPEDLKTEDEYKQK